MADPGKETVVPAPPPPPETEAMNQPSPTAIADAAAPGTIEPAPMAAPAAVVEPGEGTTTTTPPPPPQEPPEPAAAVASALDPAPPTDEPARRAPPREEPDATAAAGEPPQTTADAGGQPTKAEDVGALPPPPSATPSEETAAAAAAAAPVESENQLTAAAAPPPLQQPPQEASSVHEEKDATPAPMATDGRRRWRQLQAAVRLIFLPCKRAPCGGHESTPQHVPPAPAGKQQPVSGREEKKATPAEEGATTKTPASEPAEGKKPALADEAEMKPSAPDGKQPASGQQQVVPPPPPAETSPAAAAAAEAAKSLAAPPSQKQEGGGAPGHASSVQEEDKGAAPATATAKARRRWRLLSSVSKLLFLHCKHKEEGKAGDGIKPATAPADGDKGTAGTKLDPAPADDGKKQPASATEKEEETPKPPHPKWPREEERLEQILEDAFTKLLAAEFHQLRPVRKKCLLTFSVFDLAAEVKKQAMLYWWVAEFNLRHHRIDYQSPPNSSDNAAAAPTAAAETASATRRRISSCWQQAARKSKAAAAPAGGNQSPAPAPPPKGNNKGADDNNPDAEAEGIFSELSSHGFLEPMKNWCTRAIHGCKVNPLVHWMVKRRARDDRFADLDVSGSPAALQPDSKILCLTAGNRPLMQKLRMEDESQQAGTNKPNKAATTTSSQKSPTAQDKEPEKDPKNIQYDEIAKLFKGKQVILNVNAHVYPVSKSTFLHLADSLVVLQLGRWCNLDDDTYMEVDGLESLRTIGLLKNLRYLSLRGLSRLTELPRGIRWLRKLAILDMRGCQNLVNVASYITTPLKQLTHLDLTECYMLEYIGRGITSLSELQVFKGFVFATGTQGNKACRLQDLRRLKKLQKLTISITTDANVGKGEMAELRHLTSLRKLTITWSEIPSILDGDSETVKKRREDLVDKWTNFELPQDLLKLDLRCYPKKEIKLKVHKNLKKLYLRGGDLVRFSINETNTIKTLRLRYLKNFNMGWEEIRSSLKDIEYVEIVYKDEKLMKDVDKDQKSEIMDIKDHEDNNIDMKEKDKEEESKVVKNIGMKDQDKNTDMKDQKVAKEEHKPVKQKKVIYSTLDENGVWVKDKKEEENQSWIAQKEKEAHGAIENSKVSGPTEDPSTKAASTITDVNKIVNSNATNKQSGSKEKEVTTDEVPQQTNKEPTLVS